MPHLREVQPKYLYIFSASTALILAHFGLWLAMLSAQDRSWTQLLSAWDAGWYLRVALGGYDAASSAFLPLYPALVRGLGLLFNLSQPAGFLWAGILLSIFCLYLALYWLLEYSKKNPEAYPLGGILLLITSPASYVFHTFHTESLFLLSSILAFLSLKSHRLWLAAFWAGIAALVRHQGVFLAISIGVGVALIDGSPRQRLQRFVSVGLISGALWGLTPLLHLWQGRSAFPALAAHDQNWFVADGFGTYFKTFIFANPIQNMRIGSILHHAFYFLMLGAVGLLLQRRRWAEAVYCLLSLLILPMQGELVDAFRFGAVLFPLAFAVAVVARRLPPSLQLLGFILYLSFNFVVAYQYGNQRWAY